jgi:hypothetical protein
MLICGSVICLDVLQGDDMVRHLPCHHYFHSSCLDTWYLRQHNTCPLCKTPFFNECDMEKRGEKESSAHAVASQTR